MNYPQNKKFGFTIVDDTDGATRENVQPIYDLLFNLGFRTTKTVWVFPPKDNFKGSSLQDYRYRQFISKLQRQGFEIALHSVGSGKFTRKEIFKGLETFSKFIGYYPRIQINHAENPDNIYWGPKRLSLLKSFWRTSKFLGDDEKSNYFWGDYFKKHIKYIRNFTFRELNTLKADPMMPYKDPGKPYAKYWFSSSEAPDVESFIKLTSRKNVDKLIQENGAAIIYTHFASGFTKNGQLNRQFQHNLAYIAQNKGYFVPAGVLLDYLMSVKTREATTSDIKKLEIRWLWQKSVEKLFSLR